MLKLFLVTIVFGGCLVWSLKQLCRGIFFGRLTGISGSGKGHGEDGAKESFFVEVERSQKALAFWGYMLQHVIFTTLLSSVLWMGLFQMYFFAESKPTIAYVQPEGKDSMLLYWHRPDRIDDPIEYLIYRGHAGDEMIEVARRKGDAADGQFVDSDVRPGMEYTYQVEARFGRLTQWLLSGGTRSEPASGIARSR